METYLDANDVLRCDNCDETADECPCCCVERGEAGAECSCEAGPYYPAI